MRTMKNNYEDTDEKEAEEGLNAMRIRNKMNNFTFFCFHIYMTQSRIIYKVCPRASSKF